MIKKSNIRLALDALMDLRDDETVIEQDKKKFIEALEIVCKSKTYKDWMYRKEESASKR